MTRLLFALALTCLFATPALGADRGADTLVACDDDGASTDADRLAQRGCCSSHGGVCGCSYGRVVCCDGALSPSCTCQDGRPEPPLIAQTIYPTIPGTDLRDYNKPGWRIEEGGSGLGGTRGPTMIYPTLPGTDLRDPSRPGIRVDGDNAHPTLPGTNLRDPYQPGIRIGR